MNKLLHITLGLLALHLVWILLASVLASKVLPMPWQVYQHLPEAWGRNMPAHLLASLIRISWGIGYSILIALPLGWLVYRFAQIGVVIESFIYLSYPIPKLALLPIVMLIAGLGEATKVIMIVLIILFQLIISIRDSLRAISPESFATLRSLGANRWHELRHLLLPAITPALLSALRIAIGTAISVLFVTETYGTTLGMGYYIIDAWMRVNYLDMYSGIVALALLGFVLFLLVDLLEHKVCAWMPQDTI